MGRKDEQKSVIVRLQGGLGDHVLGMRVLHFIRRRYPNRAIIICSDSFGFRPQLTIAAMSPLVSKVVPIFGAHERTPEEIASLRGLRPEDQELLRSAECVIDTFGPGMFAAASARLNVPIFEIFARRPALVIPPAADRDAARRLGDHGSQLLVALNLTKWGADVITRCESRLRRFLASLLADPSVTVLNIFNSRYEYGNWEEPSRTVREAQSQREAAVIMRLCQLSERIVACVDLPLPTVIALLKRSRYFIGVDNGIKHLAWALDVPHTFFHPTRPSLSWVLRWMPDLHRMLTFDCTEVMLASHIATATAALRRQTEAKRPDSAAVARFDISGYRC